MRVTTRILIALSLTIAVWTGAVSTGARASDLGLVFENSDWTGKSVPSAGICTMHGGKGMSPSVKVTSIPAGTERLVVKFTDRDWGGEGAHGVIAIETPKGAKTITIPSFKGEVDTLPTGIQKISDHACRACAGGIYLGPCSGGGGHQYYMTVDATGGDGKILARGRLVLGDF
jgi:phosphatidylethanolamine-binding protein (PEBP) family uncharacterized protein